MHSSPTPEDRAALITPDPPYPIGSATNCKRAGWIAFFQGGARKNPYPPGRDDLRIGFEEGWDAAKSYFNASDKPLPDLETPPTPPSASLVEALLADSGGMHDGQGLISRAQLIEHFQTEYNRVMVMSDSLPIIYGGVLYWLRRMNKALVELTPHPAADATLSPAEPVAHLVEYGSGGFALVRAGDAYPPTADSYRVTDLFAYPPSPGLRAAAEDMLRAMDGRRYEGAQREREALRLALTPSPDAVQSGDWVLVPREPTPEMVRQMTAAISYDGLPPANSPGDPDYAEDMSRAYRAMLAAAPAPPASQGGELRDEVEYALERLSKLFCTEWTEPHSLAAHVRTVASEALATYRARGGKKE
jgi:hypothetical protein